jgi:protein O-mannosyl-transferase
VSRTPGLKSRLVLRIRRCDFLRRAGNWTSAQAWSKIGVALKLTFQAVWKSPPGQVFFLCLLLFLVTVWTFFPAVHGDFIDIDDGAFIARNPYLPLNAPNVTWVFGHAFNSNWQPLTMGSFMLDHAFYGLKPWGYHLTNVLLHAVNCVLVFLTLHRLTGSTWRSLAVAGLFGLHPLRVESVAWISERKDVLSVLFWMLTLWSYARYAQARAGIAGPAAPDVRSPAFRSAKFNYVLTLVFFAFGLMSKPMMVTLPFVLLLLDFWPLDRWRRSRLRGLLTEKIPFFFLSGAVSAITYLAQRNAGMLDPVFTGLTVSSGERMENALVSYGRYLGKLFRPVDLCALYPYPDHWPAQTCWGAGLLVAAITLLSLALRRREPYLLTGWLWYLGTLVPVLGLVSVGPQAMADRYSYIPSLGIWMALVWGVCRIASGWRSGYIVSGGVGIGLALIYAGLTRQQIGYWSDGVSVWRRAVAVTENNFAAHNWLGCALYARGRFEEAIPEFQEASRLKPSYAEVYCSLGQALAALGRLDEAVAAGEQALRFRPGFVAAHNNLSDFWGRLGRRDEAMRHCRLAAELEPGSVTVQNNLANALAIDGRFDEALVHFQEALAIDPDNVPAQVNLGSALLRMGRLDEAILHLQLALKRQPDNAEAHNNLGGALIRKGQIAEAVLEFRSAAKLQPARFEARRNLGHALMKQGNPDEAILEFQAALRLQPDSAVASNDLAAAVELKAKAGPSSTRSNRP